MAASGSWYLNGKDLYDTYGIVIEGGMEGFLALPPRKESLSYSWPEEDGIEIDLSEPAVSDYDVTLRLALIATSEADYMAKRKAFLMELLKPGVQLLGFRDYGSIYKVYYKSTSNSDLLTNRLNGVPVVAWRTNLTLGVQWELVPGTFANNGFPYTFPFILE